MPWTHALDLTKTTYRATDSLGQRHDAAITRKVKVVPGDMFALIRTGDDVIREVRRLLPYGAGNQRYDVKAHPSASMLASAPSETQVNTALAQKMYTQSNKYGHAQHMAGGALTFGAGTCQDQAAVSYLLLRERLGSGHTIGFCFCDAAHHCFASIGIPGQDAPDKIVIVDSWPKYAQAVLWTDHFCFPHAGTYAKKAGTGQPGKLAKAQAKFAGVDKFKESVTMLYNHFPPAQYNHKWTTRTPGLVIRYTDKLTVDDMLLADLM